MCPLCADRLKHTTGLVPWGNVEARLFNLSLLRLGCPEWGAAGMRKEALALTLLGKSAWINEGT